MKYHENTISFWRYISLQIGWHDQKICIYFLKNNIHIYFLKNKIHIGMALC
jgi:hypothetical protein